jgi:hypothetical protein
MAEPVVSFLAADAQHLRELCFVLQSFDLRLPFSTCSVCVVVAIPVHFCVLPPFEHHPHPFPVVLLPFLVLLVPAARDL